MAERKLKIKEIACPVCRQACSTLEMALIAHLRKHAREGKIREDEVRGMAKRLAD